MVAEKPKPEGMIENQLWTKPECSSSMAIATSENTGKRQQTDVRTEYLPVLRITWRSGDQ